MKKLTRHNIIKYVSIIAVLFFIIWGIIAIITKNYEFIFDRFFSAAICLLIIFVHKRMHFKIPVLLLGLVALTLHHLKLYGNFYFGLPFDRIMHFTAVAAIAAIFYQYLYHTESKKNKLKISILSVLIAIGIASLMEIIEFVGYSFLGQGEGILFYGTGDLGEWNNLSWDLISNTLGAITATLVLTLNYSKRAVNKFFKKTKNFLKKNYKKILITTIIILIILFVFKLSVPTEIDPHANYDFSYILNLASIDKEDYTNSIKSITTKTNSNFAKADAYLILGRLTNEESLLCESTDFYVLVEDSLEEKALAYETIASINCRKNSKEYYAKAAKIWEILGNDFRAEINKKLANNEQINFTLNEELIQQQIPKNIPNWNSLIIGSSSIIIDSNTILLSQTDRVTRDWLSFQIQNPSSRKLLTTFSEKFSYNQSELLPKIGWHEGARIKEILTANKNFQHKIGSGTLAAKINNKWYAPDENGIFRFEIPEDKIMYPTTRFLRDNLAIVIDTHGINMIVEQAIRHKANVVLGCCDAESKVQAAKYLSDKGIKVICLTDRFVPDLLFSEQKAEILGSPPIKVKNNIAIIGDQQISINRYETIIAMDIEKSDIYAIQYYDTPARYFKNLEKSIPLNIEYVKINNFNQMHKIIEKAEEKKATVIAVRIFNSDDYNKVKAWLEKSKFNKAVLFHSVSYPYGYKLLNEFPRQTTFDDINPVIL